MNRFLNWLSKFWARRRWAIVTVLALAIISTTVWYAAPQQFRWKINYSFRTLWRSLTENWGDKWDKVLQILGFDDTPEGARVAIACTECDVCAAAINRYFHKYDSRDIKSIMSKDFLRPTAIDIRSMEEYEQGHIAYSVNMPLPFEDLKKDIWSLERGRTIIIIGSADMDWHEIGKKVVDDWGFYNVGYLAGGIEAWDGELEK